MQPPQSLIDKLLLEGSRDRAYCALKTAGYHVTVKQLGIRLDELIATGQRKKMTLGFAKGMVRDTRGIAVTDQRRGCANLLRAHLKHAHWITDPAQYAKACKSVGM